MWLATRNAKKGVELARILGVSFHVRTIGELDALAPGKPPFEVVEDQPTFAGNARKKACETAAYCRALGIDTRDLVLADDSGLCVDALNGAPGILSARYAGDDATDRDRIDKLLRELTGVPPQSRGARFVCSLCLVHVASEPQSPEFEHEAEVRGVILEDARGTGGFGYDPVFAPAREELATLDHGPPSEGDEPWPRSFAELDTAVKDHIGHRGRALAALCEHLNSAYPSARAHQQE
ncbi:MAG: non-canonical purine NTP pyrophosphatase [Planctomycetes bacterium]|nr:non-canonical purine NTP pyrophosphatase [Planctomycetota bacterium]MCB9919579.1 non-canonical purine NTP pyrophosphatase [Planctomycetota bacterium]